MSFVDGMSKPCVTPFSATSSRVPASWETPRYVIAIGAVVSAVPLIARKGSVMPSSPRWSRPNAGKNGCPKYGTYVTAILRRGSLSTTVHDSPSDVVSPAPAISSIDSPPRLAPKPPIWLGSTRALHCGLSSRRSIVAESASGRSACIAR